MNKIITCLCPGYDFIINDDNKSLLYIISKIYGVITMYDRFYDLNSYYEIKLSDNKKTSILDIYEEKYYSFEECCNIRTEEIIKLSQKTNKKIYILYSGGVDSTCVLCSFLMNARLNKNNLYILYNDYSVKEYPLFFELLSKMKINLINFRYDSQKIDEISKNDILVTGMCGDQLDGSNLCTTSKINAEEFSDWKKTFGDLYIPNETVPLKNLRNFDLYVSQIEEYSKLIFNRNIKTFKEFAWMFNFGCKWIYISDVINMISSLHENRISFYDTLYFQKWCLTHIMSKISLSQNNPLTYKIEWKKLIFKYTKDYDYFLKKGKEGYYFSQSDFPNKFIIHDDKNGYAVYDKTINEVTSIINRYKTNPTKISILEYL